MSDRIFGIYGFEFTRQYVVANVELVPLFSYPEVEHRAGHSSACHLTGYGRFLSPSPDAWADATVARRIVDGKTFAQQQHVAASQLIDVSTADSIDGVVASEAFQTPLLKGLRRSTYGRKIIEDRWFEDSLAGFINVFVDRFLTELPGDALRGGMYRQLEICRLATPFVELHHFLAFSGLEMVARSRGKNTTNRNAAIPITELLNDLGFVVKQQEVERWTAARNAAFHRGELSTADPAGGPLIELCDQIPLISDILADVCLKLLPFDDGHINWSRWHDRMPFT